MLLLGTLSHPAGSLALQLGTAIRSSLAPMPEGADQLSATFTHAPSDPHEKADWIQSLLKEMTQGKYPVPP